MMIRLRCLRQDEWHCPGQIQNWLLCFPVPLRASGCTGGLLLLQNARGWTIGSWGRRPIASNHLRFLSSRKWMRRWQGLGGHLFLPKTGLVPPPSSPPSMAERPKGMWKSPSRSSYCHTALTAKALPPGGVIYAFRLWPVSSRSVWAVPSESGPCAPFCCPTAGTSGAPLVPLVRTLGAWLALPRPSRWLLRTIRHGYTIQFCPASSQVQGHSVHLSVGQRCSCLACENPGPADDRHNRVGPSSRDEVRVLQPLLHRTQERWWVMTNPKIVEVALVQLREAGVRVLNYLDDWLILAQSQAQLCEHRNTVLSHLSRLGLRVNWEKSELSAVQRITFLGMELDSVNLKACLSVEHAQSMLNCLESFQRKRAVPLKQFQRLLGHTAYAATVTQLGLLQIQLWPRTGSQSPHPAFRPSARGRILLFFGQESL